VSIASKHAYRFGYLKSEKWELVRLEALVREKGKCQICGEESISNDAHHVWYPENIYKTTVDHLAVMCRPCHNFVHAIMPECKTRDEATGIRNWITFRNAIAAWRLEKHELFTNASGVPTISEQILLQEIYKMKQWLCTLPRPAAPPAPVVTSL